MAAEERLVGAFEAKTKFSSLLEAVRQGETIIITHRGEPVARLCPLDMEGLAERRRKGIQGLIEFRKKHPLKGLKIKDLIEEGRG